mmetsp:Transcript_3540/g.5379  ORF Transcript_3540/g.5379 Transcript_3540/m.5379 type:complete len:426 (+) Transcript_3540:60-1337(+)
MYLLASDIIYFIMLRNEENIRIDDDEKGLHVDIHRGLFASKNTTAATTAATNNSNNINWYDQLLSNVRWHRVKYKSSRFQKECTTPCYTAFYGGRAEYSPYIAIPQWFQPLIDEVNSHLGDHVQFNAFLLRLYFDGNDEIAWHTDGRTFLGEKPIIASLSLGCKATFEMRRMTNVWPCVNGGNNISSSNSTGNTKVAAAAAGVDASTPIQSFTLHDGDLLVMRGNTQKHWHHRVPKEKGRGVRLNINFRYVMPGQDAERGQMTYYKYMVFGDVPIDQEPLSWTYDEIVSRKGGIMNFVQKGVKCHDSKREQQQLATRKRKESSSCDSTNTTSSSGSSNEMDIQRYLACEQSVDREVFVSLPRDIREELVSQWKSLQNQQQSTTNTISTLLSSSNSKRNESIQHFASRKKTKKNKGTIDSFFVKKR